VKNVSGCLRIWDVMSQLAPPICKIPPAVAMSNAASSTFVFKDDNFKDTIIDTSQPLINMTDWSVIFIKDEFYFA
jgi:hypothetical protein